MTEDGTDEIENLDKLINEFDALTDRSPGVEMMRDSLIRRRAKLLSIKIAQEMITRGDLDS